MNIKAIVDLRSLFGDIRNQGERPTCMAFAASDVHSFARGGMEPLSAEYAYFHAIQREAHADRTAGATFDTMSEAIAVDGQPLETGWPYIPTLGAADLWAPPKVPGNLFHRDTTELLGGMPDIYATLDAACPVVIVMYISDSFFMPPADMPLPPLPGEPRANTHAVILVGYGETPGGRCLLVRNSWGNSWGDSGYQWIDEGYLVPRLRRAGGMN
jgi:hypothetical protein